MRRGVVDTLLRRAGLEIVSVICKTGGIDKKTCGIPEEHTLRPGQHESRTGILRIVFYNADRCPEMVRA